jgi:hypothetical protein
MPTPEEEMLAQWAAQMAQSQSGVGGAPDMSGLAEGDWMGALARQAEYQGVPQDQMAGAFQNLAGSQAQQYGASEAAKGGGTWMGDDYFAAQTPEAANARTNSRFGNDMAWLDPMFQESAGLLGSSARSQVYSDPRAQEAQWGAMQRAAQMTDTPLQFQGSGQQQGLMNQWAGVQSGQGAPQFMGGGQQQEMMNQLLGVKAPQFSGDADQRAVLNQALGLGSNSGPGSLQFDTSGRQGEQYGNLQDIIAGGGATSIEMANRQKQRADSESWLRGQREADMSDYAERGMTGSGMELLALSGDRQAAAGRNSLADLETAKALEERRLGAINSAGALAGQMRGQTIDEQGLLTNKQLSGLSQAASVANAMRGANFNEQSFLNQSQREQAMQAAQIAEQSRSQGFQEQSYLDKRVLDALNQQTALSGQMRDQTANEQIAGRNAQQNALNSSANIAGQLRDSSYNEAMGRAEGADQFSMLNQQAINGAMSSNTSFLQQSYGDMMRQRQQWEMNNLNQGIGAAQGIMGSDQREQEAGFNQANQLGKSDAATYNAANSTYNDALLGQFNTNQKSVQDAAAAHAKLNQQLWQFTGQSADTVAEMATGGAGGGYGAAAGAGGGLNSAAGATWSGQGASNGFGGAPGGGTPEYNDIWKDLIGGKK